MLPPSLAALPCPEPTIEYPRREGWPSAPKTVPSLGPSKSFKSGVRSRAIIASRIPPMGTRTNEDWLHDLQARGEAQAAAIAELRTLLLRASLYSFRRTQYDLSHLAREEVVQLAEDSAQDALLAVLKHLHEFRGESKFTTWAYKFAINVALSRARKETWKHVSLDELLAENEIPDLPIADKSLGMDPDRAAWQNQVWSIVREVIENDLTTRQRQVLKLMVFDEVPMDEVAEHFNTNRNAIYKLLHDARRKLKARLEARGLAVAEIMNLFAKA